MVMWVLVAVVAFAALGFGAAAFYCADAFTRSKRRRVQGTPAELGLRYDEVQFRTPDMTVLRGWFLESPGARATVVVIHGGEGTRADPRVGLLRLQQAYLAHGFHVFAFDLRGRGESSGVRDGLGSAELTDLLTAVAYVRRRTGTLPVVLHGFGLGAALALQAVGNGLEADGIIADSPFASARAQLRHEHRRVPGPLFSLACTLARKIYGADVDVLMPVRAIGRIVNQPILLVHGEIDQRIPVAQTLNLAAASLSEHNEVWVVPEAGHCQAFTNAPEEYVRRCVRLIESAVPARTIRLATAAAV